MSKKSRNKKAKNSRREDLFLNGDVLPSREGRTPRVLFAAGDADFGYTEGNIWRLARRLKDHLGWDVVAVSQDREALDGARKLGLGGEFLPIESPGVLVTDRLRATDEMIRETAHVNIPGSDLPVWKVLAMDDFLSSLQLFGAQPKCDLKADLVVVPLMAIDNNTKGSCGLYTWLVAEARRKNIPVLAIEVSPLGNKNTLAQLPADHYAVKSHWSKEFLIRQGLARGPQVSVLRWEETSLLWPGCDDYTEAFLTHESKAREMLNLLWDEPVIVIPHHVAFLWEVRKILEALALTPWAATVVVRVEARTVRRQYHEREIVMESYGKEIRALPRVVVDEQVGVGLLLQIADLVISPFAGTTTERAQICRKPTIICQAMGQEGWQGEFLYWEPWPQKLPELIAAWKAKGWLERRRLAHIVAGLVGRAARAAA